MKRPLFTEDEQGFAWWCCFDEELGDNWSIWDTAENRDADFLRHMSRCHTENPDSRKGETVLRWKFLEAFGWVDDDDDVAMEAETEALDEIVRLRRILKENGLQW